MKRRIAVILKICMLFSSAVFADSTITSENFDAIAAGGFSVGGWTLTDGDAANGTVSVVERSGSDMAVRLEKVATDRERAKGVKKSFAPQTDDFTLELELNLQDGTHYINLYDSSTAFPPAVMLSVSNGILSAYNGEENTEHSANIYYGTWSKLSIYVEPKAGVYSVYVDNQLIVNRYALRVAQPKGIDSISISTVMITEATVMEFDTVVGYTGLPEGAELDEEGNLPQELIIYVPPVEETPRVEIYSQNFDGMGSELTGAEWVVSKEIGTTTIEDELAGRTKVLKFNKGETEQDQMQTIDLNLPETIEEDCTIEMQYLYDPESKAGGVMYVFDAAGSNPSGPTLFLTTSISAFNGDKQDSLKPEGVTSGQWYKLAVHVRPAEGTYDVYVNDIKIGDKLGFRNPANKNVKLIRLGGSNTKSPCIGAIDDIRVYTGSPEIAGAEGEQENTGGSTGTSGQKILLSELKDYSKTTTPRLAKAIVMMVDKYTAFVNNHSVKIDPNNLMVKPVIVDDRTLVPVRFIAESLGGTVTYDGATGKIGISANGKNVEMTLDETEMLVDGEVVTLDVPAQILHDRTMIPLRAMVEAVGKKVFWDDSGLIVISDNAAIFNPNTEQDVIAFVARQFDKQSEINSPSPYSDVYLSSRWFRTDGTDGQLGTLDALKRFMATGDKWSYISTPGEISSIVDLGVTFQSTINTNMGGDSAKAQLFDGTLAVAPWMSWGATWNCMNNPEYHQILKDAIKSGIDNGVTQFQFDDWAGNVSALSWGGCFCNYCMEAFSKYLKENYTAEELRELGVDNVDTFNFKTYMTETYGATDNNGYLSNRSKTPLTPIFEEFQLISTRNVHAMLKEYMDSYAGKPIQYSHNVFNFGNGFNERTRTFCYDIFDGGMGESKADSLTAAAMVSSGYLSGGINRPFIYSPLPEGDGAMELIRQGVALAYATGQYMLVPWDTWLHDDVRYFATVEEIGDMYHFIRQYPQLFDNYEVPAKIGLLADLENVTAANLRVRSFDLFTRGVPFKDVVSKRDIPTFEITAENLVGLEYLIEETPISNLRESEQQLIADSGIQILSADDLTDDFLNGMRASWTEGYTEVYTVLREKPNNPREPKIVHVLNRNGHSIDNLQVKIAESNLFWGEEVDIMLYAPGENPQKLEYTSENGVLTVTLPTVDLWGILRIAPKGTQYTENFGFQNGWSGINLGTRQVKEDNAVATGDNSFMLTAAGRGFNVITPGDTTGSQEQMPFVYQNFGVSKLQNYAMQAKLDENGGMAGIMVREYPTANARFVALYQENGKLKLAVRDADNAAVNFTDLGDAEGLPYLKIENKEGKMLVYASADGQSFGNALSEFDFTMTRPLGGVFCASPNGEPVTAVLSDVKLEALEMSAAATPTELTLTIPRSRIEIGKYQSLTATCTTQSGAVLTAQDFDVTYTSSNPEALTVDNKGRVDAIAVGTATITASATIAGVTVQSQVTVNATEPSTEIFNDNFDDYSGEALPEGWVFSGSGDGGSYARVVQEPADYDKSISIYDNTTTGDTKGEYSFEETYTDPLVIEFDYMVRFGENKDSCGSTILYTYDQAGSYGICLFASPTHFWYIDMGENTNICEIEENRWYKIMIYAYPQEQKMDFYLDGNLILEGAGFRTPVSDFAKMQIGGNVNALDTTAFWNNMKVYLKK